MANKHPDGHGDSMTESAQWSRFCENKIQYTHIIIPNCNLDNVEQQDNCFLAHVLQESCKTNHDLRLFRDKPIFKFHFQVFYTLIVC